MAPPRRRPAQKRATFSSPASMAQAQRAAEAQSMGALQDRREQTRQDFFKGRPDISSGRLDRRQIQADLYEQFKSDPTKTRLVGGTTNLYQAAQPGGMTLTDKAQELAFKYGPTPREVLGDIGYGLGSIGSALGQKFAAGELGIMGIAKGLYEQFTNSAGKAKDALVKGVEKLSDIDIEILKNKDTGKYKFTSKKPEIQEVETLQEIQMTEFDKANLIRQNMERISTPITEKDNTVQSAKVFDDSFRRLPATGMTQTPPTVDPFIRMPGTGYQAGAGMGISGIPTGFEIVSDYKSPEARMQELIEQNKVNNTNMFDLGINNAKNQLSELERVFGVDMR